MKNITTYHLIPLGISVVLVAGLLWILSSLGFKSKKIKPELISVSHNYVDARGHVPNLSTSENQQRLYTSFRQNHLTLFGSSEFTSSTFCPFYFFPDSLGIPAFGVGHGYHQSLSILIECLAFSDEIEGKNICVILSPGWFEANGTNTSAFIEFANAAVLNRIIVNQNIPEKYTEYIGKFIAQNQNYIEPLSYQMEYLRNQYLEKSPLSVSNLLNKITYQVEQVFPISYSFDTILYHTKGSEKTSNGAQRKINYAKLGEKLKKEFVASVSNNSIFVNDSYFETYVKGRTNKKMKELDLNNTELADFEMLMDFLTTRNAKISVVMQTLNPYFYDNMETMLPIIDRITEITKEHEIPFLNMYSATKQNYEPGILTDIMHTGDYGWVKINSFLDSLYHE